ncbi:MAG: antibiotic biosynthesis monooxygenase family protein [Dehalococcoidia bacterium]
MLYVRVSLMRPKPGCEQEVAEMMDSLVTFYATQPGYLNGYKLRSADDGGLVGRVTVWQSGDLANTTAQSTHVLAQRALLQALVDEDSDAEWSFDAAEASEALAGLVGRG